MPTEARSTWPKKLVSGDGGPILVDNEIAFANLPHEIEVVRADLAQQLYEALMLERRHADFPEERTGMDEARACLVIGRYQREVLGGGDP